MFVSISKTLCDIISIHREKELYIQHHPMDICIYIDSFSFLYCMCELRRQRTKLHERDFACVCVSLCLYIATRAWVIFYEYEYISIKTYITCLSVCMLTEMCEYVHVLTSLTTKTYTHTSQRQKFRRPDKCRPFQRSVQTL